MKNSFNIKNLILITLIVTITPVIFFIIFFKNQFLSNEISDWALFGDYIGGTVNTLISFASLLILSYLTYVISQNSNKENKKLNILQRKLDVYNELTSYTPKINLYLSSSSRILQEFILKIKRAEDVNDDSYLNAKKEFVNNSNLFIEFHFYMYTLKVRYSHLFEYDFSSEEFQLLLESTNDFNKYFKSVITYFTISEGEIFELPNLQVFIDRLAAVINSLRNELE